MTYLLDTNAISELMRSDNRVENWMAGLAPDDRIVTCSIVRGEILFGIARLPPSVRREELTHAGLRFLDSFHCEPVPKQAGDIYAAVKLTRQRLGLTLDENDLWTAATALALDATLVSRDRDFSGIEHLRVVAA